MMDMQRARKVVGLIVVAAALCAALAFLVPIPAHWKDSTVLFYSLLSLTFGFVALHIGAAILFFMGLGAYKKQLRHAYIIICSSMLLLAIGILQLPVISALDLWSSHWVTHGGIGMPFLFAELTAYFGVRSLARLIGLKSVLSRATIILPALAVLNALTALLPHVSTTTPESSYDLSVAVLSWGAMVYLVTAWLVLRVRQHMGAHYTNAMAWLFLGFSGSCGALVFAVLATLLSNKNQDGWSVVIDTVALLAGLAYVRAGLAFVKTREY
jgi:hypothetical protein